MFRRLVLVWQFKLYIFSIKGYNNENKLGLFGRVWEQGMIVLKLIS
jgi:hypothetical protein